MGRSRIVLITGGTSGIGLELVKKFSSAGDRVFTCSRRQFDFRQHVAVDKLLDHVSLDVSQPQAIGDWIQTVGSRFGQIDVLINNAAGVIRKPVDEFTTEEFRQALDVNLLAVMQAAKVAVPFLAGADGGVMINMSSMAAVDPFTGFSVYGACKAFIELFTQALANELQEKKIHCFSIRAGAVDTPLLHQVLPEFPKADAISAERIAELIFRVASSPGQYPNGKAIEITSENLDQFAW